MRVMPRLYEQGADVSRIGAYARQWGRWVQAGVTLTDEVWTAGQTLPAIHLELALGHRSMARQPRRAEQALMR
jgi:hypothetical protein